MKIKEKASEVAITTKRITASGEQFVQAVALLVVAGFSYYSVRTIQLQKVVYWVVLAALVIIGLRGLVEFVKFLDRK